MSLPEICGAVFALICIWLTVRQNIWCWPIGILNNLFWIVMFWQAKVYAQMGLQVVYIALGFYGWHQWRHGGAEETALPVARTSLVVALVLACISAAAIVPMGVFLDRFTDTGVPYADAATTVLSLVAQWMLTKKLLENWGVWVVANLLTIGICLYTNLLLTAAIQPAFIALSIMGFLAWKQDFERQKGRISGEKPAHNPASSI